MVRGFVFNNPRRQNIRRNFILSLMSRRAEKVTAAEMDICRERGFSSNFSVEKTGNKMQIFPGNMKENELTIIFSPVSSVQKLRKINTFLLTSTAKLKKF